MRVQSLLTTTALSRRAVVGGGTFPGGAKSSGLDI
jgi:hypothetical protein